MSEAWVVKELASKTKKVNLCQARLCGRGCVGARPLPLPAACMSSSPTRTVNTCLLAGRPIPVCARQGHWGGPLDLS